MSEFIPPDKTQKGRFLNKTEAKRLMKKLEMKYGAQLEDITARMAREKEILGHVSAGLEAEQALLIEKIKAEEKHYEK